MPDGFDWSTEDTDILLCILQEFNVKLTQYQSGNIPIFSDECDRLMLQDDLITSTNQEKQRILAILIQRGVKFDV